MPTPPTTLATEDWGLLEYTASTTRQLERVAARIAGTIPDTLIFVEHPAVYTIGAHPEASTHLTAPESFLKSHNIAVCPTNRGGDITLHAPGQLVVYPIIRLSHKDLHRYLRDLEEVIIRTLGNLGLPAGRLEGKTGVWVPSSIHPQDIQQAPLAYPELQPRLGGATANLDEACVPPRMARSTPNISLNNPSKIAAIGVAVKQWVSYHGVAINVCNDLNLFGGIIPCGLVGSAVTSLAQELPQNTPTLAEVKTSFQSAWAEVME